MAIKRKTFERLLTIVETFPGYFAGSNADLPIVGDPSRLMTITKADATLPYGAGGLTKPLPFLASKEVQMGIVRWPLSVLRLQSGNKEELINLGRPYLRKLAGLLGSSSASHSHI